MKKAIATLCILGTTVALGACANTGTGYTDSAPYAQERTASSEPASAPVSSGERVFTRAQAK